MKKRILSILLCLCMAACMLPTVAFAADKGKAIQLGTNALNKNVNTATAPTVYFGQDHGDNPGAWRVIGYDGNGVAGAQGDMTLLAASNMGVVKFANDAANNKYAPSNLKTAIDKLAGKLTAEENAAVKKRTLTSGKYNEENTDCVAGAQVDNAVFWPLSSKEAIAVNNDLRIADKENPKWASSYWWLRSPGSSAYVVAVVKGNGSVSCTGHSLVTEIGVRPAFNLNLNSVLFISAAEHGKVADLTTPIAEYAGDEWKLTLHDSDRDDFTAKTVLVNGSVLEVEYKNAKVGDNEYISAVIKDADGSISRYTRVVQLDGTTNGTRGRAAIDLTGIDMTGKTLCVFNEQFNGNHKTDYAGALREVKLTDEIDEQFTLAPGGRYYFDLSSMNIPGTVNSNLPDSTLRYVPFTYAGTVDAYKLTSETATTEEYAQQNKYPHSLFIADYNVTHKINWDDLNTAGLIFGKDYAAGGVDYTLRAPSVGSGRTYSGESQRGTPLSNEWDKILDKDSGYIKNWSEISSWGQDTKPDNSFPIRANRGNHTARSWNYDHATFRHMIVGFRPVLEVRNPNTLSPNGLKVVTLALGGGKLGNSSEDIQIIVKNGGAFTAPASNGLTHPDGNTGSYFMWLGSNGKLYAPGESVPEVVTTLTAQWTANQYTITYDLAGGTAEGNPNTYTIETGAFTLKNPTKSGYTFTGWSGTGLDGENNMTVTIPTGSTGNRIYTAHWRYNGSGHSYSYYTIKATAGAGGSISPSGNVSVREGRDRTFTITPDKGYAVSNVKIDGKSIGAVKSYTFENVRRTHTIEVIFMKANGNPQTGVFVDVPEGSYYEDAVDWAVENGITKGTDDTHFSPDGICTRAQAVTFLWRTAGSPKPETRAMPFTDVPVGSYYYDAVLWAVENGITKGTSDTTFSPNMTCTRAQIVAFLWRSEKSPAAGIANPFADVKSTAYYADAVLWAVKENITKGTTSTTFSPNADCTRAQIVTFLWRCKK